MTDAGRRSTLTKRIQLAAFALTMLVVLAIGGSSLVVTLLQIPGEERQLHSDAARIVGVRMASDLGHEIAGIDRLAESSLIWTALTDSYGREAYLQPFLTGRDSIESGERILLLDYRARIVAGLPPEDVSETELKDFATQVLDGNAPRFHLIRNGASSLLAGFPVIFPYTEEAIGVLIGSIPIDTLFQAATVGIAEHHGVMLLQHGEHGDRLLARVPEGGEMRNPIRFPIELEAYPDAAFLALRYYSTDAHWLGSVITLVAVYAALALLLGVAVWVVSGYIAERVTHLTGHTINQGEETR